VTSRPVRLGVAHQPGWAVVVSADSEHRVVDRRAAKAAPGILRGNEYLIGDMKSPNNGRVSVTRLGSQCSAAANVQAVDAQFWTVVPLGSYELSAHAGDAPCPPVRVTVESGLTVHALEIDWEGR
jgi:hypothetical protein